MSLKDVLVIVDNDPACASRLDVALGLAEAHQAHLTGLHVMPWPAMPVGAYGHTRLREMVLGGATRHLLRHMTVPVLLSH